MSTDLVELDIAGEELREYIVLNRRHHWRHHHELGGDDRFAVQRGGALTLNLGHGVISVMPLPGV